MKKFYFLSACAAFLLAATTASAQFRSISLDKKSAPLPEAVSNFLKSDAGKAFSEDQVREAYGRGAVKAPKKDAGVMYETVLTEDFAKWTSGSEDAPDSEDVTQDSTKLQSLMTTPGDWSGLMAYQAGGMAYLGWDSEGDDGPGYLKTHFIDLTRGQGVYRVTMRARSVNPDNENQMLQIWSLDEGSSNIINAQAVAFGSEWTDLEWILSGGKKLTSIMFYANSGKALVDDLKVEQVFYPLATPDNVDAYMADVDQVKVSWDAVDDATSYYVYAENSDDDDVVVAEATVENNVATLNFTPIADTYYRIVVVAKNGDDESYPGSWWGMFEPEEVGTPVALAATNVSETGFTANWERGTNAAQHIVAVTQKHVATADGEEFTFFDDDFSSLDDATDEAVVVAQFSGCDKYFKRGGWTGDLVAGYAGMIALTNLYAAYGYPGSITSPAIDFSLGDGKVKVSGVAMSLMDDAVLSVALKKGSTTLSEQTVDVAQTGSLIDVELEGGEAGSQLVMSIYDASEDGDYIFLDNLKMTMTMNKDQEIKLPYSTTYVSYPATSLDVEMPLAGYDDAWYTVQGYFSDELTSDVSNEINVKEGTAIRSTKLNGNAKVSVEGGYLTVSNPSHSPIAIYTVGGQLVAQSKGAAATSSFELSKGAYIVRVDGQSFKVIK